MRKVIPFGMLAALLTLLVALPVSAGGNAGDPPGLARAIAAQEGHTDSLMDIDSVVGTGVGLGASGRAVVFVLTEEPGVAGIPRTLDGVPVVPQFTGKVVALNKPPHDHPTDDGDPPPHKDGCSTTERCPRPVPIGVSTGHPDITDGANVFVLSNNHIYADSNSATIGDNVLQPGAYDGG